MKKNKVKNSVSPGTKPLRCPYCGSPVILRSADGIYKENSGNTMLYVCTKYPACDAYVRVLPGSGTPAGSMADRELRSLRYEAHRHFDRLYLSGLMTRKEAYEWLAHMLQAPQAQAHIGHLGEYYCRQVIGESKRLLESRRSAGRGQQKDPVRHTAGGELYAAKQ